MKKKWEKNRCFEWKRKKSTLECGQFYLHCLPLCLITCSTLFSFSLPSRLCALLSQFIAYTWIESANNNKKKKESREPFAFLFKQKKKQRRNIWIFMRTCFDSSCRSALAKPSCLSGTFFPHFVVCLFRDLVKRSEKKIYSRQQQQGKCAFFLWS